MSLRLPGRKTGRRTFAACLVLSFGLSSLSHAADERSPSERIENLLQQYAALGQFNGSALVAKDGTIIHSRGYGLAAIEWDVSNAPDSRFRIGSISKSFTATLIAKFIAAGDISLQSRVSDLLPYYRKDVGDVVTIQHLLTHTDGLPNYTAEADFWSSYENDLPYETQRFIETYCSGDLQFQPGSQYRYGNSGYSLLGAIVEQLTGEPFEIVLEREVFAPMGMRDTSVERSGQILARRAVGYRPAVGRLEPAPALHKPLFAAGDVVSSTEDLYRFDRALRSGTVVSNESYQLLFHDRPGAQANTFAFGWSVGGLELPSELGLSPYQLTNGQVNGFHAALLRLPEEDVFVVLLSNHGETNLFAMLSGVIDALYGQEPDEPTPRRRDRFMQLLETGSFDEAADFYRTQREEAPGDFLFRPYPLTILGMQLLRAGDNKTAIGVFELNLETHDSDTRSLEALSEAYLRVGDVVNARATAERALALAPGNESIARLLERIAAFTD